MVERRKMSTIAAAVVVTQPPPASPSQLFRAFESERLRVRIRTTTPAPDPNRGSSGRDRRCRCEQRPTRGRPGASDRARPQDGCPRSSGSGQAVGHAPRLPRCPRSAQQRALTTLPRRVAGVSRAAESCRPGRACLFTHATVPRSATGRRMGPPSSATTIRDARATATEPSASARIPAGMLIRIFGSP